MEMLEPFIERTAIPEWEIAIRLAAATLLGGAIGWDREAKNRPAGLRTHMLTGLAACAFTIVALELVYWAQRMDTPADPIRAIEAVTAGVAFLAAGTIIQSRGQVKGLTTGAGMWTSGAIGVAAGNGLLPLAAMVTVIALFILAVLQFLSSSDEGNGK